MAEVQEPKQGEADKKVEVKMVPQADLDALRSSMDKRMAALQAELDASKAEQTKAAEREKALAKHKDLSPEALEDYASAKAQLAASQAALTRQRIGFALDQEAARWNLSREDLEAAFTALPDGRKPEDIAKMAETLGLKKQNEELKQQLAQKGGESHTGRRPSPAVGGSSASDWEKLTPTQKIEEGLKRKPLSERLGSGGLLVFDNQ